MTTKNLLGIVPAVTGESRVFLLEGQARADHEVKYMSSFKAGAVDKPQGDRTPLKMPDPNRRNGFITVRQIEGESENPTTTLMGRYLRNLKSTMLRLSKASCPFDLQFHFGSPCDDPSNFEGFEKVIVFEDARITNWSTEDLGALEDSENAKIDETVDISASEMYELMPLNFAERANTVVTNEVKHGIIADELSCGDCDIESDGYQKLFAISLAAGGSLTTPADVIFSLVGGTTWEAHDIDSLGVAEDPCQIAEVKTYLVVVSNDSGSLHYAEKDDFYYDGDPAFTEVTTGFVVGKEPNAISSYGDGAYVVGDGGYVYKMTEPSDGVDVLDAGSATVAVLTDVFALSEKYAVAVGNDGAILYTTDGNIWAVSSSSPKGIGVNATAVFMRDIDEWFVAFDDGTLYYTLNGGVSWSQSTLPGTTPTSLAAIASPSQAVMYVSGVVSSHGRIWRSINGGNTWTVMPRGQGSLPLSDSINFLASPSINPDFLFAGGLGDDGADGYIVIGDGSEA